MQNLVGVNYVVQITAGSEEARIKPGSVSAISTLPEYHRQ